MEPYKQFSRFKDAAGTVMLEEFTDAREVVQDLVAEYAACEQADYVCVWGGGG